MNKPELLSPAGNFDSLKAAIAAGADAVYFGHSSFSNRARAKNFTDDQVRDAVRLCASAGVRVNAAVNIRIREHELNDALRVCDLLLSMNEQVNSSNVSLIVADFGLAVEVKKRFPGAILHASTQTSLSSVSDCRELKKLGFSRIVLPRELSRDEILRITEANVIETEIFIHGAHCVSLSGQCLMSYVMGGRSGNRGDCAQPCRLCYNIARNDGIKVVKNANNTPLSLADMCLAGGLADVLKLGVSSLKIEGRLKNPEYVYGVTRIYRRLIDEGRNASAGEKADLVSLFSRGFTDGYYRQNYTGMSASVSNSRKSEAEKSFFVHSAVINREVDERVKRFSSEKQEKIPVRAVFKMHKNEPAELEFALLDNGFSQKVVAKGAVPAISDGRPADFDYVFRSLSKLGETPFSLDSPSLDCRIEGNLWLPTSSLNELRRHAAILLEEKINCLKSDLDSAKKSEIKHEFLPYNSSSVRRIFMNGQSLAAEFYSIKHWSQARRRDLDELLSAFDIIYVPLSDYENASAMTQIPMSISLPPLTPDDVILTSRLVEVRSKLSPGAGIHVLVHTIGQAAVVRLVFGEIAEISVSFRANITNIPTADYYSSLPGVTKIYGSPELPGSADGKMGLCAIVSGRLPLMHLSRCILSDSKCRFGNTGGRYNNKSTFSHSCSGYLTDRRGEKFPVISASDCANFVFNSQPIWMGDKQSSLRGCPELMFIFTDETIDEGLRIFDDWKKEKIRHGKRL